MTIQSDSALGDPEKLEYDSDLDYSIADQLAFRCSHERNVKCRAAGFRANS